MTIKQRYNDELCAHTRARFTRAQQRRAAYKKRHGAHHPMTKHADDCVGAHLRALALQIQHKNMTDETGRPA